MRGWRAKSGGLWGRLYNRMGRSFSLGRTGDRVRRVLAQYNL